MATAVPVPSLIGTSAEVRAAGYTQTVPDPEPAAGASRISARPVCAAALSITPFQSSSVAVSVPVIADDCQRYFASADNPGSVKGRSARFRGSTRLPPMIVTTVVPELDLVNTRSSKPSPSRSPEPAASWPRMLVSTTMSAKGLTFSTASGRIGP